MVDNNSIMAHYDAVKKGEETISSSYEDLWFFVGWVKERSDAPINSERPPDKEIIATESTEEHGKISI